MTSRIIPVAIVAALLPACSSESTAPPGPRVSLEVHGDTVAFAAPGSSAAVQVVARRANTEEPEDDVVVRWRIVSGSGTVSPASSSTGTDGAAGATVASPVPGTVLVSAEAPGLVGRPPRIPVHFVDPPRITSVDGGMVRAGDEAVVRGSGFSTVPAHNVVTFAGVRGLVLQASATELRVRVPACLPTRNVEVRAALGSLAAPFAVVAANEGPAGTVLSLEPGQVARLASPDALSCVRLPAGSGTAWLITVHNVDTRHGPDMPVQVRALDGATVATMLMAPAAPDDPAMAWEAALRDRERRLWGTPDPLASVQGSAVRPPVVGDRRTFNVLNRDNRFDRVTAEVRLVTPRATLWLDVAAAQSLAPADLQRFAEMWEDVIYDGVTDVFGAPGDVDGDGRVGILFTPAVNRLTARNSSSFIAGYFYGCDLVSRSRCEGTNSGEIFYSLVPDPTGVWADARSRETVLAAVPPVLAHEFQHMISFARRGFSSDALWLSEGLAHAAEDVIADVLDRRGDAADAVSFRAPNRNRAARYLRATRAVRLLNPELPGTLEQRGGAWLFLQYLQAHHGGYALLHALSGSTRTGAASVAAETGRPWADIWSDFGVAIWADGAPGLAGALAPRFTFGAFRPRQEIDEGSYPLSPLVVNWRDFNAGFAMGSGGHAHLSVAAGPGDQPLNVIVGDAGGGDPGANIRASVLRIR